ncbi:hypothetical protein RsTz2092_01870 [Deferribacterales bacterium RsTz2092]|nr:hypothetical protein AGMMS49941_02160 [Deferribacterales bacterium]
MRAGVHPDYKEITFKCACGAEVKTRSTTDRTGIAICSSCHPFFTGKQKFVDTAGRVEKFMRKYAAAETAKNAKEAKVSKPATKVAGKQIVADKPVAKTAKSAAKPATKSATKKV